MESASNDNPTDQSLNFNRSVETAMSKRFRIVPNFVAVSTSSSYLASLCSLLINPVSDFVTSMTKSRNLSSKYIASATIVELDVKKGNNLLDNLGSSRLLGIF